MICGCGHTVYVEVPNRLAYRTGMCSWVDGSRGCTQGALGRDAPLCADHLRAAVDAAEKRRLQLATQGPARARISQVQRDVHATREHQALERQDRAHRLVRDQAERVAALVTKASSVVYYARLTGGRIKIGVTTHLPSRMQVFRVRPEDLLAVEPGEHDLEALRHRQFAHLHLARPGQREEFTEATDLTAWIQQVRDQHGAPYDAHRRLRLAAIADLRENGPLLIGANADIYDRLEAAERAGLQDAA